MLAGDEGSVPGLGKSPEGGNGNPFQYSCLKKKSPMDRGAWQLELDTTDQLSIHALVQTNKLLELRIKGYYDL